LIVARLEVRCGIASLPKGRGNETLEEAYGMIPEEYWTYMWAITTVRVYIGSDRCLTSDADISLMLKSAEVAVKQTNIDESISRTQQTKRSWATTGMSAALVTGGIGLYVYSNTVHANMVDDGLHPAHYPWSHKAPWATFDYAR
jgi:hypothetical protein